MGRTIVLADFQAEALARTAFREWRLSFADADWLDVRTCCRDLPDTVLLRLAEDHGRERFLLHDLIMRVKRWGSGYQFESLPTDRLLRAIDAHCAVLDTLRFELMRRLGWVEATPELRRPLLELVEESERLPGCGLMPAPSLTPNHPCYEEDQRNGGIDRPALARKAIADALKRFRSQVETAAAAALRNEEHSTAQPNDLESRHGTGRPDATAGRPIVSGQDR